jgi:hypothetical protein
MTSIQPLTEILDYIDLSISGFLTLVIFILLIVVVVMMKIQKLEPSCQKGFTKFFIWVLTFYLGAKIFDFVYDLIERIMTNRYYAGKIELSEFSDIHDILWGSLVGLKFLVSIIAYFLLFGSMEIFLFHKKSKGVFGVAILILLGGSFIMAIVRVGLHYTIRYIANDIAILAVTVLFNFNLVIIAIGILILLGKTTKENGSLKKFQRPIGLGVVFLYLINPLIIPIADIAYLIFLLEHSSQNFLIYIWISNGVSFATSFMFLIGIILLTIGAIKSMSVPLTFAREKNPHTPSNIS